MSFNSLSERCLVCGYHIEPWASRKEKKVTLEGVFHRECHKIYIEEEKNNRVLEAII